MNAGTIKLVKVLSWLLVITGLVYALKLFGVLPMPHPGCMWKKVHVVLGIITIVMCLWHCIDHWKWYKAWLNGRLRNNILGYGRQNCMLPPILSRLSLGWSLCPNIVKVNMETIAEVIGCNQDIAVAVDNKIEDIWK